VKVGQLDHRGACGNRFYVQNGVVSNRTQQHAHKCPLCGTVVWSAHATGRIHVKHSAPSGRPCERERWVAR
jgi:hypothetical protein